MKFWKASCLTLLVSVSFAPTGAFADDRFTCWAPTAAQAAFTADYWTDERRRNAIPDPGLLPDSGIPGGDVHSLEWTEAKRAPIGATWCSIRVMTERQARLILSTWRPS